MQETAVQVPPSFLAWPVAKQERREALVRQFLAYLKKKRMRCEYITDLADLVATHITEQEGKNCNRATLLRNKRYKVLLLSYMAMTLGDGTAAIDRSSIKDPKASALIAETELGAENLRREVNRLRAYIAELEAGKSDAGKQAEPAAKLPLATGRDALWAKYIVTCQALLAVLKHFDGLLVTSHDARRIIDASSRPPKVVVDEKLAEPFFEWMHLNREVGGAA